MIMVDRDGFDKNDLTAKQARMRQSEGWRNPSGVRYAICLPHALDMIAAVLYLRDCGGSALLFHADTPFLSAKAMAESADCRYLLYRDLNPLPLSGGAGSYEPSLLQYSSGTTGAPTLIDRPWTRIDEEIAQYNRRAFPEPGGSPIILVPVSHSYGLITGVLAAMDRQAQPTIVQHKNPKFALALLKEFKEHVLYTVPYLYSVMDALDKDGLICNRVFIAGAPPTEPLLERMKQQSNEVWQQYGCTETGCISLSGNPLSATDVGEPLAHLRIDIRRNDPLSEDPRGEIIVADGAKVTATRDIGHFDASAGRLRVYGRIDDLINVSGLKVIPSEVEKVIDRLPGVRESVVFGARHPVWGESVKALVAAGPPLDAHKVRAWCIQHLPAYKVPGTVQIVSEIPRTKSGKLSRKQLQEQE